MPRKRETRASSASARARSSWDRVGKSLARLASAQPRYCVLASSTRCAPKALGEGDVLPHPVQVVPMQDDVDGEGEPERRGPFRARHFGVEAIDAGDGFRPGGRRVLQRDLHGIEPRRLESAPGVRASAGRRS